MSAAPLSNYQQLVIACVLPFQELEGVFQSIITMRSIYNATGWLQDLIGKIVGQPRNQLDDDTYRRYQFARIATNGSSGKREQLIRIAKLVLNDLTNKVHVINEGNAGSTIRIEGGNVPTPTVADALISFLRDAPGAGIKIILETATADDADSFAFGVQQFASSGISPGDTVINVPDTSAFPTSGHLLLDVGVTGAETVAYTGVAPTQFLGVTGVANSHASGSEVQSVEGSIGLGFAEATFATSGLSAGNTSIPVTSTTGFPTSGSLILDAGLATQETVTYTSVDPTHFLGVPASGAGSIANSHSSGAEVQLTGVPAAGGAFADARA